MGKIAAVTLLITVSFSPCSASAVDEYKVVVVPLCGKAATGNAVAGDVLTGRTFSSNNGVGLSGTMPDIGKQTITPTTYTQAIAQGYHDGSGTVAGDEDLKNIYILKNVNIYGVKGDLGIFWGCRPGTDSWSATACATDCLLFSAPGLECITFCNNINNQLSAYLPYYNGGAIICGGSGGR